MKVFFSYGHDQNVPLVKQVRRDLEAAGHEIWIDTSEIKAGDDWRRRIVDGLSDSDWIVAFLSKHATRDPGVCLDELAIALNVKGGAIGTVLVEAVDVVRPPVSLSHIQWLDMQDWASRKAAGGQAWQDWYRSKLAELLLLLASPTTQQFAGEISELEKRLQPVSQDADIGALVDGFVGRNWLLQELETWRTQATNSRLFWLIGSPGCGKSAFAAWLAHHARADVIGVNFCRYNVDERRNPTRVLCTLAFQIATRLSDYRRLLLQRLRVHDPRPGEIASKSPAALFDWLLIDPLRLGLDGGRREHRFLMIIDALDETLRNGRSTLAELLAESAQKLPAWIALVVTSRPEPEVMREFSGFRPRIISAESEENRNDLCIYARSWITGFCGTSDDNNTVLESIVTASQGNFLYLRKLREASENGLIDLSKPHGLPHGLIELYGRWFRHQFSNARVYERYLPVLEVLAAAEHPVPESLLDRIFGWTKRQRAQMLEGLGSFFERRHDSVAPYHKSLRDWLIDERAAGAHFVVDAEEGRRRIVDALWVDFSEHCKNREGSPLDPFCVAELPIHILRMPPDLVRAKLGEARSWSEIWDAVLTVSESLAARFDRETALTWWQMACRLAEAHGEKGRLCHAHALRMSGDTLKTLGRSTDALDAYQISLVLGRALVLADPTKAEHRRGIVLSLIRLGNILVMRNNFYEALTAYGEALNTMRSLCGENRKNNQWRRDLSVILERIGDVHASYNNSKDALFAHRKSLAIRRALVATEIDNTLWRRELAVSLSKTGDMLIDRGDRAGALPFYRESLEIMQKLSAMQPDDNESQRDVHASLSRLGDLLKSQRQLARSLAIYREALDIMRRLCAKDASNVVWRRDIFVSLSKIGDALMAQRNMQGAIVAYSEALDIIRSLSRVDAENAEYQVDIVSLLWRLALIGADSRARWTEALTILRRLESRQQLAPEQLKWIETIEGMIINDRRSTMT